MLVCPYYSIILALLYLNTNGSKCNKETAIKNTQSEKNLYSVDKLIKHNTANSIRNPHGSYDNTIRAWTLITHRNNTA